MRRALAELLEHYHAERNHRRMNILTIRLDSGLIIYGPQVNSARAVSFPASVHFASFRTAGPMAINSRVAPSGPVPS